MCWISVCIFCFVVKFEFLSFFVIGICLDGGVGKCNCKFVVVFFDVVGWLGKVYDL